jgi:hypothetical protein
MQKKEIPWWEKYTLTVAESAIYFGIGEKALRKLIKENENADFLIHIGVKVVIKRKKFEQYLDEKISAL